MKFMVCQTDEQVRLAQALRYKVFCAEKSWISSEGCEEETETDAHDSGAVHFLALDNDGTAVGTSRYLIGRHQELPAAQHIDLASLNLNVADVTEVSRLATLPASRSHDLAVFLGLTRLMWHWGMEHSVKSWMAIADVPLFHLLTRLRIPVLAVAPSLDYMGSECVPVAFDMPGSGAALYRRRGEDITPVQLHEELVTTSGLGVRA